MLLVPSAISLEQGENFSMHSRACILSVVGKEDTLDFGLVEELPLFFHNHLPYKNMLTQTHTLHTLDTKKILEGFPVRVS